MSIQGEEWENKLYTQSGNGEYKRKEMTGKTKQMITNGVIDRERNKKTKCGESKLRQKVDGKK